MKKTEMPQAIIVLPSLAILLLGTLWCIPALPAEATVLLSPPGERVPQPRQRGMDEVAELPTRDLGCPACSHVLAVPEVDKLMRHPANAAEDLPWRMHAASRDADLCPYPGPGKLPYHADIIVCPSCGFSASLEAYYRPLPEEARAWVVETFRPSLRAAQMRLLGRRAGLLSEEEMVAFFNRQSEIPDVVRTEHARVYSLARKGPALDRARAAWLAAWAIRREIVGPPKGEVLARRAAAVEAAAEKGRMTWTEPPAKIAALNHLLTRDSSGNERLDAPERLAARILLAGQYIRLGRHQEARDLYAGMEKFCRDRYSRPEQDPFWPVTGRRAEKEFRRRELEEFRTEAEAEIRARGELLNRQEVLLGEAATLLREAISRGEVDGKGDAALVFAHMTGEFLRRSGNIPLSAEWFTLVVELAPADSPLGKVAGTQLDLVREQAGDKRDLLSAVGEDREALERVRSIQFAP